MMMYTLLMVVCVEYLGLASQIGILKAVKFSLLTSLVLFVILGARNQFKGLLRYPQGKLLLAFIFLTALSILHGLIQSYAFETFTIQVGYFILFANVFWAVTKWTRIRTVAIIMVLLHGYLVLVNFGKFFVGVRAGRFQAGYFMGDGNDFGWSLVTFLPFMLIAYKRSGHLVVRCMLLASSGLMVFGILGTGSRGASLGLAAQVLYLVLNSNRKAIALVVTTVALIGVLIFLPDSYTNRMSTIKDYKQDSSAQGRMRAWKAAALMALNEPLGVGAGCFNSAFGRSYREQVVQEEQWGSRRWISAHSIYFLTLGEYGFPGLLLLLALLYLTYRRTQLYIRNSKTDVDGIRGPPRYLMALNTSLIGYSACGLFLGGINYPHLFLLLGLTVRCYAMIDDGEEPNALKAPRSPGGPRRSTSRAQRSPRSSRGKRRTES